MMIEVTQADRDITAAYWKLSAIGSRMTKKLFKSGEFDSWPIVQAFASHRIASTTALQADNERLRENIRHCQGRFLNINIALSSGGTKAEAIQIADSGEDCCKGYLEYGQALGGNHE